MGNEPKVKKTRKRATAAHRCVNCRAAMRCPDRCEHEFRGVGAQPKREAPLLGLCVVCIKSLSRAWPPGYPVDDETRALVRLAKDSGENVAHLLAVATVDKVHELDARLRDVVPSIPDLVPEVVTNAIRGRRRREALSHYLEARAGGTPSKVAAAEARRIDPTLRSAEHVRKESSLLAKEPAPVTRKTGSGEAPKAPRARTSRYASRARNNHDAERRNDVEIPHHERSGRPAPAVSPDPPSLEAPGRRSQVHETVALARPVRRGGDRPVPRVADVRLDRGGDGPSRKRPVRVTKGKRRRPPP